MYGVPESAGAAVEKADKTQYWKCLQCALEGVDNHLTDVYQFKGTIYCLFHAQKAHGPKINRSNESNTYVDTPNGPSGGFYLQTD